MAVDSMLSSGALLRRDNGVGDARSKAAASGIASAGPAFEAILLKQVVRAMRATVPESGLLGRTTGQDIYDHLIETALSDHIAQAGGVGVAELFADAPSIDRPAAATGRELGSRPADGPGGTLETSRGNSSPADSSPPLSATIPPQDDAWLDSPQVIETLRRSLLTGRADLQVIEKTSQSHLRESSGPPVDPNERDR